MSNPEEVKLEQGESAKYEDWWVTRNRHNEPTTFKVEVKGQRTNLSREQVKTLAEHAGFEVTESD